MYKQRKIPKSFLPPNYNTFRDLRDAKSITINDLNWVMSRKSQPTDQEDYEDGIEVIENLMTKHQKDNELFQYLSEIKLNFSENFSITMEKICKKKLKKM